MKSKNLLAISFAILTSSLIYTGCGGGGGGSSSNESPSILGTWKSQDGSTSLTFPNSAGCNGKWKGTACSGTSVVDDEDIDLNILLVSGESINLKGKISGDQLKLIEGTTQTIIIFKDSEPTPKPTPKPDPEHTNVSGTWILTITETYDSGSHPERPRTETLFISQHGSTLKINVVNPKFSSKGDLEQNRIYFTLNDSNIDGSYTEFTGTIDGSKMSGIYTGRDYETASTYDIEKGYWNAYKK